MKKLLLILSAYVLALIAAGGAQALTLTQLFSGDSITANDKLFDRWTLISQESSEPNRVVNTDNVVVTPLVDGDRDPGPGLRFGILDEEFRVDSNGPYAYLDFQFGYRVTVLDPMEWIKGSALERRGLTFGFHDQFNSNLGIYIQEEVGTVLGLDDLAITDVTSNIVNGEQLFINDRSDSAVFPPQSQIFVTTSIRVWAENRTGFFSPNTFIQRFSQVHVPEPATLALLGLGLLGMVCARRRRRC